ncbi:MAG: YbhB/YbcL family Raf kinase inhibitor-like protein [Candidatus Electrothrix aestuarii]|uniref:YbhB/YbcL family Raf kinase inhibitor-like protein n=1 Tax=Candidatus Electrothrix aestuarii TaxID=3062594 RepID=A0AAU8LTV1_9BACT|nr:YbhB/YbcL family Raf kinase inhibitor-like protein [Candidatus Electrothrix aestuarii]
MFTKKALAHISSLAGSAMLVCSAYAATTSAGESNIFIYLPAYTQSGSTSTADFTLTSSAVADGELLEAYKCEEKVDDVENSIPLAWSNVPDSAGSLAVIMHHYPNPDDTSQANSYLLLWDIDPSITEIPYGEADDGSWYMGSNKDGTAISYTSPCSPSVGTHEYTITLYALSETPPSLPTESTLEVDYDVLKAAIETVTVVDTATLTFNDVNE